MGVGIRWASATALVLTMALGAGFAFPGSTRLSSRTGTPSAPVTPPYEEQGSAIQATHPLSFEFFESHRSWFDRTADWAPVLPAWAEPSNEFKHVSEIGEDADSGNQAFAAIYSNPIVPIAWIDDLSKGSLCDGIADGPGGISLPDPTTENEEIPKGLLWLAFRDIYGIEPLREMVADRLVKAAEQTRRAMSQTKLHAIATVSTSETSPGRVHLMQTWGVAVVSSRVAMVMLGDFEGLSFELHF